MTSSLPEGYVHLWRPGALVSATPCPGRRFRAQLSAGMKPLALVTLALLLLVAPAAGQAPTPGGWLNLRLREDLPQGFAIHESPTISTMWPAMPCFSNLVLFDQAKPTHGPETIVGE